MRHPSRHDPQGASPEQMREALEAFEAYSEASLESRPRLLAQLEADQPDLLKYVRELIAHEEAGEDLFRVPAVAQLAGTLVADDLLATRTGSRRLLPRSIFAWAWLASIGLAALLYVWSITVFAHFGNQTDDQGWVADWRGNGVYITQVEPGGPAEGKLRAGDRIVGFNGHPEDLLPGTQLSRTVSSGGRYRIDAVRDQRPFSATIQTGRRVVAHQVTDALFFWAVSFCFSGCALTIGVLKPGWVVTRLAAMALLAQGMVLLSVAVTAYQELVGTFGAWCVQVFELLSPIHFALAYHFYAAFFDDLRGGTRRRPAIPIFYIWSAAGVFIMQIALVPRPWRFLFVHPLLIQTLWSLRHAFFLIGPLCICGLLLRNYLRYRSKPGHQRARWIVFGSLAGIFPYVCYRAGLSLAAVLGLTGLSGFFNMAYHLSIVASIAVPVSALYAVLKYQVFDIHVILRRGLRYILLTRVLQLLLLLPSLGLFISLVLNKDRSIADLLAHNSGFLVLLSLLIVLLLFRGRLQRLVEQRYGQDAAFRTQAVLAAQLEIRRAPAAEVLAETLADSVQNIFDPAVLMLLFEAGGAAPFQLVARSPLPTGAGFAQPALSSLLHPGSPLVQHCELSPAPQRLHALPGSLLVESAVVRMQQLGVSLVLPLLTSRRLVVGLLLLGERETADPYNSADLLLLRALGEDAARSLETLRLQSTLLARQADEAVLALPIDACVMECPACGLCCSYPQAVCAEDATPLQRNRSVSLLLKNRYRLDRRMESGGMGIVYQGRDLLLDRTVAVKIMVPSFGEHASNWKERAEREGQALARLSHPNIVAAYDFGCNEQGAAYLVMEFVNGKTLRRVMEKSRVPVALVAAWFAQLLDGLAAAHGAGIIHRDLKPENIMIVDLPEGAGASRIKVLDFGIARLTSGTPESRRLTLTGSRLGTPRYMSPEQFTGAALDERTDLFSAAVILVELLTGELPSGGFGWMGGTAGLPQQKAWIPLVTENDLLLNDLLQSCLALAPEHRPRSAAELGRQLLPLLRGLR